MALRSRSVLVALVSSLAVLSCASDPPPPAAPPIVLRNDVRAFTIALNDTATVSGPDASNSTIREQQWETSVPQAVRTELQNAGFQLVGRNADVVATVRVTDVKDVDWGHNGWAAGATLTLTAGADERVIASANTTTWGFPENYAGRFASALVDKLLHSQDLLAYAKTKEGSSGSAVASSSLPSNGQTTCKEAQLAACTQKCEAGDGKFCTAVGNVYWERGTPEHDFHRALDMYIRACDLNQWDACNFAGDALTWPKMTDQTIAEDDARAVRYFDRSCSNGYENGCTNLGLAYDLGRGVTRDENRAGALFAKACPPKGDADSAGCSNLARHLASGVGATKDDTRAGSIFKQVCAFVKNDPNSYACAETAWRASDKTTALRDFQGSCDSGNPFSCDRLKELSGVPTIPAAVAASTSGDVQITAGTPQPTAYAVVIGIESYAANLPPPIGARADAEHFASLVRSGMGLPADHVQVLLDSQATKGSIERALEWVKDSTPAGGRVYFYFSGHGAPDASAGTPYIVPNDGDPRYLDATAIPMREVLAKLGQSHAKEVLAFVDSCFSGAGGRSVLPPGARPLVRVHTDTAPPQMALLTASTGSEISGPVPGGSGGVFTKYLVDGLGSVQADANGDGQITLRELTDWVKPRVERDAKRDNRTQTPALVLGRGIGPTDGILVEWGLPTK